MRNPRHSHRVRAAIAGAASALFLVATAAPALAADAPTQPPRGLLRTLQALLGAPEQAPSTVPPPPRRSRDPEPTSASAPSAQVPVPAGQPSPATPAPGQPAFPGEMRVGAKGPQVRALEVRLDNLRYFVGPIDETYDAETAQAVMAFQKVNGMERTGVVTESVWRAIQSAGTPAPLVAGGASTRVEVDLGRQVLFLYKGGRLDKIIAASTGNGEDYCENGSCGTAVTPVGDFAVYRQGTGWETGPLGSLYNPQYFLRGYAIHGSLSVPAEPASHGCVRIPMGAAEWLPGQLSNGTPVHVR